MADTKFRPIKPKQRMFVELMVYQGLKMEEAFAQMMGLTLTDETRDDIKTKAGRVFHSRVVYNYYNALMEEVRDKSVKKGAWTKEVAEEKLMRLIEHAEDELYGTSGKQPQRITLSRLNAIILPAKELNTMNGLNTTTNVNLQGEIVQIIGEDNLLD